MTETPPETTPATAAPEPPAKAEKRRRTRLQAIGFVAGCVFAALAVLVLIAVVGGRQYLLTGPGRDLLVSFVQGQKISRYGRINVEGLSGDLFDDFTLRRVTITDRDGVWLEARNVRVDWDYLPLITRRFHADLISADVIRLIRRPIIDPPDGKPPQPSPISVGIDRFAARVEFLEGFSKEYGAWSLDGSADIPRFGNKDATVNAYSASRPGDFLKLAATFGAKPSDLRLNLQANEARGGPIAGSLGYSLDQPFTARALVNGEKVEALVRTGGFTPLYVNGWYGKAGARIAGYADFSGSDLLAPFVQRVGRTARFGFAAVPDPGRKGWQGVGWRLIADNFESHAQGFVRMSDQSSPDGIALEVSTPSLARLVSNDIGGPAAYQGTFRGNAAKWSLQGQVSLLNADLASYRAVRIAGPLGFSADNGRLDLDADVTATGGRAEGVIGGLLGAAPRVQLSAARMKDGAVLLERIDAQGQGLTLAGSGSRGLNGALGFRGRAEVTDMRRVLPGARGAFGGPITASQARAGAPYRLTFDGRGRGLAIGQPEADRLLGPTPRLQLAGQFNNGRIEIEQGLVTGAQGNASARGLIEAAGRLRLALNWNARGPFGVGPVAIDGAMTGQGALTGTLAQPRADLTAAFDKVSAGPLVLNQANLILSFRKGANASDGRVALTSGSNYGPARASGDFYLGGKSLRLSDVDLNAGGVTASGAIALANNFPSSADLRFSARPGAFLTSGSAEGTIRLTEGAGDDAAVLAVTGRNVRFVGQSVVVRSFDLNGRGTLARLPFTLKADVGGPNPVQFDGTGQYSRVGDDQTVSLSGAGRVREIAFTTRSPAVLSMTAEGRVARVDLGVGGGALTGTLRQTDRGADIQAELAQVDLGSLMPDMRGQLTGRVSLSGAGETLTGAANIAFSQIRSVDAPRGLAIDGRVDATLNDQTLHIVANANDAAQLQARADVTLPVEASAAPLRLAIARTRAMSGDVTIKGQIQPIWDLLLGGERSLSGQVDADAKIAGTLAEPRINGRLAVADGAFRDNATGLRLGTLTLAAQFDDTTAVIQTFSANDGSGGTVTGDGRIGLKQGSGSNFELALTRFRVIDNDLAEARASGPITVVRGADGNIQLSGRIDIDDALVRANPPGSNGVVSMDVVEINKPGGDEPEDQQQARSRGPQIELNIQLRSPGGDIRVVGRGLNVELGVNATVTGTIAQPSLTGTARVVRGDYEFAGKRFVFDDRGTIALSTDPARIRLNLQATREDPALTAVIRVTGTAASPKIDLTSTPSLPQDEILSHVLFGRSASQLSAFEAAQLAAGVASLAGGGGFDVIGNLRELAGLDRLSFGGEASALTVAGGRYITDDIYLEVIGGGQAGAAVNVEWQVRRNLTVSSKLGAGETSLSIRWRRETRQPGTGRRDRRPNRD